tara:strand:+ start:1037 stop:1810 length:774 start_codon:yes stop_codon:yes gene_type:complete
MEPNKDLRISTMTLISQISTNINLMKLYENLEINDTFKFIQFGNNPIKGNIVKKVKNPRKKKETKYFYNQLTLHVLNEKIINVKVFNNGGIQMTGLKREEQGNNTIQILLQYFKNLPTNKKEEIFDNINPELVHSKIVLINSDFDIKFKINRELLHRLIISLGLYSSYEPTIYPGVNIKYYFNSNEQNNGVCKCTGKCNGKGINCCKKITIAVFNSGKIIITGGQSYEQLNTAYDFIQKVIGENRSELIIIDENRET